jgi:SAM-dependent methyltransferase
MQQRRDAGTSVRRFKRRSADMACGGHWVSDREPLPLSVMAVENVFDSAETAAGYARARPPVHPPIIDKVSAHLRFTEPVATALDVGCGAGLSTRALLPIARNCVGIDPTPAMIQAATTVVPAACFLTGEAERLPIRSGSIELLTAGGSLNYVDLGLFFAEAQRVLTPQGALVVYDFSFGRRSAHSDQLERWYATLLARWPKAGRGRRELAPDVLARGPLLLVAEEEFRVELTLDFEAYVDYVMTETNIAEGARSGTPLPAIRAWCTETLRPIFSMPRRIEFDAYLACFTRDAYLACFTRAEANH